MDKYGLEPEIEARLGAGELVICMLKPAVEAFVNGELEISGIKFFGEKGMGELLQAVTTAAIPKILNQKLKTNPPDHLDSTYWQRPHQRHYCATSGMFLTQEGTLIEWALWDVYMMATGKNQKLVPVFDLKYNAVVLIGIRRHEAATIEGWRRMVMDIIRDETDPVTLHELAAHFEILCEKDAEAMTIRRLSDKS